MKLNNASIVLAVPFLLLPALQSYGQSSPGPEHKKLEAFVGDWTFEQETRNSPSSSWQKSTEKWPGRWIPGGFFVAARFSSISALGEQGTGLEILGYDPIQKKYLGFVYSGNGSRMNFTATFIGNAWTQEAVIIAADGSESRRRSTWKLSADASSLSAEILTLTDGEWWVSGRVKGTKAKN